MSTVQTPTNSLVECDYNDCDSLFEPGKGVDGHCSEECYYGHRGSRALQNIKHDHRFCSSCYRPLKDVYRPDRDELPLTNRKPQLIWDSFIGFQDPTEHSVSTREGRECVCGNVDHYHSDSLLRDSQPYSWYLMLAFEQFRSEGQIEQVFDLEVFVNEFWRSEDLRYSVGKALHA